MLGFLRRIFMAPGGMNERHLEYMRSAHLRWEKIPYGQTVQILRQHVGQDLPVGTVGKILSEEEHGIRRRGGVIVMTTHYPGLRGVHVLVKFGDKEPRLVMLFDLAPA